MKRKMFSLVLATLMILSLLARNLWRIGLVLLPILLFAIFGKCR